MTAVPRIAVGFTFPLYSRFKVHYILTTQAMNCNIKLTRVCETIVTVKKQQALRILSGCV